MFTSRSILVTAAIVAGCGCGSEDPADLYVEVRTDLRPGYEFVAVQVDLLGAGSAGPSRVEMRATADQHADYIEGIRIAEYEDVDGSQVSVEVTLLDSLGRSVLERTAAVRIGALDRVVTVVLTRDCRDVSCPGSADDESLTACLGGRCVDPRCTPETPELCPAACSDDSQCAVTASCATGRCDQGTCFRVERRDFCDELQWCDPDMGCVARPTGGDAAVARDGGVDAAPGTCVMDDDCPVTGYCAPSGRCEIPTCMDGVQNQYEVDVDCGGGCPACVVTSAASQYSPSLAEAEYFGDGIAASGELLAVAGTGDGFPYTDPGSVYIHRRNTTGTYVFEQTVVPSTRHARDAFGSAMALDGGRLLAGAWATSLSGQIFAGRAYIFERQADDTWLEVAALDLDQTGGVSAIAENAQFGSSVALYGDWALVGAGREGNDGNFGGWVYLFQRQDSPPDTWVFVSRFEAAETEQHDYFGTAMATDGTWLVVGAPNRHLPGADPVTGGGAAYLFERVGDSWVERQRLQPVTVEEGHHFGLAVALEGNWVAVGAPGASGGDAYLFENVGGTWIERDRLAPSGAVAFGRSLSMDGARVLVGAPEEDGFGGAAYLFGHTGEAWTEDVVIRASDGGGSDQLGRFVLLSGSTAFIGSSKGGPSGSSGALYIVRLD